MNTLTEMIITVAVAIVGLAMVSVLVSKKSQTPAVIQSAGSAFSNALGVAESPVTGATYTMDLSYPGTDLTGSFGHG